jgi:uncharacterized protein YgiM (DUF1202 family)
MRTIIFFLLVAQFLLAGSALAKEDFLEVTIADPYTELHTGPGRAYPIFHVIDRGEKIKILKRKTDWFKVRSAKGVEGWVHRNQMEQTLTASGQKLDFNEATLEHFTKRRWEMGLLGGDFDGAASLSLYGSYYFVPQLSVELLGTQAIGNFSSNLILSTRLVAHPFPEWRISPYFALGTGIIDTTPKATLVSTTDRQDNIGHVGVGADVYLTKRFVLRLEYTNYVVFTSRDENEEINEWKAGFAVFF